MSSHLTIIHVTCHNMSGVSLLCQGLLKSLSVVLLLLLSSCSTDPLDFKLGQAGELQSNLLDDFFVLILDIFFLLCFFSKKIC